MGETLRQRQSRFVRMVARLILHAEQLGFELTFGHAWRPHDQRLHGYRLAVDLNLFKDGTYLSSTESHRPLGEYWESIGGTWGGRFDDGNHYSLGPYKGMK
jgi:hypothetical protein